MAMAGLLVGDKCQLAVVVVQTILRPFSKNHYFSPGDRGFALALWLMTPLVNPQTRQERSYNEHHTRTRAMVERTIGVLKDR